MDSAFRLELEYLNVRLRKSRTTLLQLQSILTPVFREAVYQLSARFALMAAQDNRLRTAQNLQRRDARLHELGFRLGDILCLTTPHAKPICFKLEQAEYQSKVLALPGSRRFRDGEIFRLMGHTAAAPGCAPRKVVYLIDDAQDAKRVSVRMRALAGGLGGSSDPGPCAAGSNSVPTFLSGLTPAQIATWRDGPRTAPALAQLSLAKSVFFPKRTYWEAIHRRIHGKLDFAPYRAQGVDPILTYVPLIYAEGRRLVKLLGQIEGRTVQGLMLFPTGTLLDVGPVDVPMWVRVERIDKGPTGVYIVGEHIGGQDEAPDRVRVAVVGLEHAERIRERLKSHRRHAEHLEDITHCPT